MSFYQPLEWEALTPSRSEGLFKDTEFATHYFINQSVFCNTG